jgi:CxxC-x17-CxxC domain-containing protein
MQYEDISLVCVQCGAEFVFTAGEQEFFDQKGFAAKPKRCKSCRSERRKRGPKKKGGGIYRSPAFENSAPAHQKIRGERQGRNAARGEYRSPAFKERDQIDPSKEYRSPAFKEQDGMIPEQEYRAPGFKEYADIKIEEEYRAPGFREHANINVNEEYRSPAFRNIAEKYVDEKPMFAIVCDACGKKAMVPFLPDESEERLCKECYLERIALKPEIPT